MRVERRLDSCTQCATLRLSCVVELNLKKAQLFVRTFRRFRLRFVALRPLGAVGLGLARRAWWARWARAAVSVACLTVYDMCKAVDRGMEITDVRLLKKDSGKTGLWLREG